MLQSEAVHTNVSSDVRVQPTEDDVAVGKLARLALAHYQFADGPHGPGLLPSDGILVLLAYGTGRGTDGVEDEMRVLREKQNEALAYRAGCAQNTCTARSC